MNLSRREVLSTIGIGSAALLTGSGSALAAPPPASKPLAPGAHSLVPLPFDSKKLKGISEKMIVSHHDNNYAGAVKNLNKVEGELALLPKDAPGFVIAGLKQHELTYSNSMILHEHYFANLGGDGKIGGAIEKALALRHGSIGKWEEEFRATGASLGGGSGWTVLDYNFHSNDLRTYWSSNHTQALAFGQPLLVLDMYEHAYQMDYGAAAAKYIDAFFQNIQWDEVNRRFERAQKASAVLRA